MKLSMYNPYVELNSMTLLTSVILYLIYTHYLSHYSSNMYVCMYVCIYTHKYIRIKSNLRGGISFNYSKFTIKILKNY